MVLDGWLDLAARPRGWDRSADPGGQCIARQLAARRPLTRALPHGQGRLVQRLAGLRAPRTKTVSDGTEVGQPRTMDFPDVHDRRRATPGVASCPARWNGSRAARASGPLSVDTAPRRLPRVGWSGSSWNGRDGAIMTPSPCSRAPDLPPRCDRAPDPARPGPREGRRPGSALARLAGPPHAPRPRPLRAWLHRLLVRACMARRARGAGSASRSS